MPDSTIDPAAWRLLNKLCMKPELNAERWFRTVQNIVAEGGDPKPDVLQQIRLRDPETMRMGAPTARSSVLDPMSGEIERARKRSNELLKIPAASVAKNLARTLDTIAGSANLLQGLVAADVDPKLHPELADRIATLERAALNTEAGIARAEGADRGHLTTMLGVLVANEVDIVHSTKKLGLAPGPALNADFATYTLPSSAKVGEQLSPRAARSVEIAWAHYNKGKLAEGPIRQMHFELAHQRLLEAFDITGQNPPLQAFLQNRIGMVSHQMGDNKAAQAHYAEAARLTAGQYAPPYYNMACAIDGRSPEDAELAIRCLHSWFVADRPSAEQRAKMAGWAAGDSDLAWLRDEPAFKRLLAAE
jgi:hypothetical protein